MKKFSFKLLIMSSLIACLVIAFSISPINTMNANAFDKVSEDLEVILENSEKFEDTYKDVSLSDLTFMQEKLKKSLESHQVILNTQGELDFTNVQGKTSADHNLIYLPILYKHTDTDMNKSFFAVGFKNKKIDFYYEIKIIGDSENTSSEVAIYSNGNLLNEQTLQFTEDDFIVESQEQFATNGSSFSLLQPQKVEASWWSKFNDCLASKGIASWAITSLSVICGFACIGTAGAGCVPCLLGAGLLTEGVIAYCAGKAKF